MFSRFPDVLTKETCPQAWSYVARKFVWSRKCHAARNLVERAGHFLFLFLMLFFANGLLYRHLYFPGVQALYKKAPWFLDRWLLFDREILRPAAAGLSVEGLWGNGLCCLLLAWALSFLAGCLVFLLSVLVYYPKAPAAPEDSDSLEAAQSLLNTARAACPRFSRHPAASSSSMFYLLAMIVVVTLILVPYFQAGGIFSEFTAGQLGRYGAITVCVVGCYSIANIPLALLLPLLYRCAIPKAHMAQMEAYLKQYAPDAQEDVPDQAMPVTDPETIPRGFARYCSAAWLSGFPEPITAESFSSAWRWTDRKLRWAEKRKHMYHIASMVCAPLYAIGMTALVFELLCQLDAPLINLYLSKLAGAVTFWEGIRPMLYGPGADHFQQGIAWARVLYLLPLAVSCAAGLAVALVYHPKSRRPDPSDPPVEQARQLCLMLREARSKSRPLSSNLTGLCNILFSSFWGILAFGIVVFYLHDPAFEATIQEHGTQIGWIVFGIVFGLSIAYRIIAIPLTLPLRLLCSTWVPRKVLTLSEAWFARCEEASQPAAPAAPAPEE